MADNDDEGTEVDVQWIHSDTLDGRQRLAKLRGEQHLGDQLRRRHGDQAVTQAQRWRRGTTRTVLALSMALILAACGGGDDGASGPQPTGDQGSGETTSTADTPSDVETAAACSLVTESDAGAVLGVVVEERPDTGADQFGETLIDSCHWSEPLDELEGPALMWLRITTPVTYTPDVYEDGEAFAGYAPVDDVADGAYFLEEHELIAELIVLDGEVVYQFRVEAAPARGFDDKDAVKSKLVGLAEHLAA